MQDKIQADLKDAMLSKDEVKTSTLRLLIAELKNAKIQKGEDLADTDVVSVVQKEMKKRKESVEAFKKGGRDDAASKEEAEIRILQSYLPPQMSDEELTQIVESSINEVGATQMSDMGRVIGVVMGKIGQGAEGARVSSIVKAKLSQ